MLESYFDFCFSVPKGKHAVRKLSAAAIYIHLSRKMATQNGENGKDLMSNQFQYSLPIALKAHYQYLQSMTETEKDLDVALSIRTDYKVAILCNTFSTAQDFFAVILNNLNKAIGGSSMLPSGMSMDSGPLETIPMAGSNIQVSSIRGHSKTTWTEFCHFLTTAPAWTKTDIF